MLKEDTLWGFYSGASKIDNSVLDTELGKKQPYYAVPKRWEYRKTLPLTANGKTDKKALLESTKESNAASAHNTSNTETNMTANSNDEISISHPSCNSEPNTVAVECVVPPKKGKPGWRALRHRAFSLYRRFFSIVLFANSIAIIVLVRFCPKGKELESLGVATATNLTVAILMRQDHVVNALFKMACSVPTSTPLFIRRVLAKVYHIGGLHSGCAVAATIWLILFSTAATLMSASIGVQVISYIIVTLLIAILASAYPSFRARLHNRFELIHRFAGWTALALFWAQATLVVNEVKGASPLGLALCRSPNIWLLAITTFSIALPWLRLRQVTVRPDVLSNHAIRLYFEYCTPVVGSAVRLSSHPLVEWHAFATIAKPGQSGFSVLVSNAGDWTSKQIRTAPTKIWVRGVPACGVLRIAPLFKAIVLVATGSGIGPCLPVIYARAVPTRIFWSTPNPQDNFGEEIIQAIMDADEAAVIHNTKTMGRPDMVAITYKLLKESRAEAVCVISNKKLTQMIVYAMESRGIPAFGAIFDS